MITMENDEHHIAISLAGGYGHNPVTSEPSLVRHIITFTLRCEIGNVQLSYNEESPA